MLKDIWVDKIDGVDDILAEDINSIARNVIEDEEAIALNKSKIESNKQEIEKINDEIVPSLEQRVTAIEADIGDISTILTSLHEGGI